MPASAIVAIPPAFIYPVPSLAAVPAVAPASTTNLPPVTQAALSLDSAAAVRTWSSGPSVSGVPGNPTGSVYAGAVADGSAGMFLYGTASTYDAQRNLDGRFGQNYEPSFASTGVAVFKFSSLLLDGAFTFKTSYQRLDAALIGVNGISNSLLAPSFTVDVSGLRSLFIGTENGPLSIGAASFAATPGSTFRFLQIYGRGTG